MKLSSFAYVATICTLAGQVANAAIELDLENDESIKKAAGRAAFDMSNTTQGTRRATYRETYLTPYYWWECGAM
jgi:mannan endo-1,6-alpha-mannosidase